MKLFSKTKTHGKNTIFTRDEVLGYFDDIVAQKLPVEIEIKKNTWVCGIYQINDKKNLLRIQDRDMVLYNKEKAKCGFSMAGTWFEFSSVFSIKEGKPYLNIPEKINHRERRAFRRTSFSPREGVNVSILENIGKGIGVKGTAANLSIAGMSIKIERTILLQSEKEIAPQPDLIKKGTKMALIRIDKIPGLPSFDIEGVFFEIRRRPYWNIIVQFPRLEEKIKAGMANIIEARSPRTALGKKSRKKRLELEKQRQNSTPIEFNDPSSDREEPRPQKFRLVDRGSPVKQEPQQKTKHILIIGETLDKKLQFLIQNPQFNPVIINSLKDLIGYLGQNSPDFIFSEDKFQGQKAIDILHKLVQRGVVDPGKIFIFVGDQIADEDLIKCKQLGIRNLIKLPVQNPAILFERLNQ